MKTVRSNKLVGQEAERIAMCYLNDKGFVKQAQNYRFQRAEVDLIARKKDCLLFVEIKMRSKNDYGYPESFVSNKKKALYMLAANEYVHDTSWEGDVRFDVIALSKQGQDMDVQHFKDAFY